MSTHILLAVICILVGSLVGFVIYMMLPKQNELHNRVAQLSATTSTAQSIMVFERIFDHGSKNKLEKQLQEAGWYDRTPAFIGMVHISCLVVSVLLALFCSLILQTNIFVALALPIVGYVAPRKALKDAIAKRKSEIACELPDFLDVVSSSVTAGVALNGALLTAVDMCSGPLGDEFRATLGDIRMGRSRYEAMTAMAERVNQPDLSQMITAITQSEKVGGNISALLADLGQDAREARLMRAEARAGTLPTKMTIPMAVFLLPALFVIMLGPIVVNLKSDF